MVFKKNLQCRLLSTSSPTSFEVQLIHLNSSRPVLIILIYRPPTSNKLVEEFTDFLGDILTTYGTILILGDFNIHVCCAANALAKDFLNLISFLNFVQ